MDFNEYAKETNKNLNELLKHCYRYKKRKSENGVPIYILIDRGLKHFMKYSLRKAEIDKQGIPCLKEMGYWDADTDFDTYQMPLERITEIAPAMCVSESKVSIKGERARNKLYYICIINDGYFNTVKERKFIINHEIGHAVHDDTERGNKPLPPLYTYEEGFNENLKNIMDDRFKKFFSILRSEALADLYAYKETGIFIKSTTMFNVLAKTGKAIAIDYKDIFEKYGNDDIKESINNLSKGYTDTVMAVEKIQLYFQLDLRKKAALYYQKNHTFDNFRYVVRDPVKYK